VELNCLISKLLDFSEKMNNLKLLKARPEAKIIIMKLPSKHLPERNLVLAGNAQVNTHCLFASHQEGVINQVKCF
jgi:hypothetical protein